jgi:uncharacterized MAPEG superfamily protein
MTAFTAVLLYAAWTLLLPIIYAGTIRVPSIASGRKRADHWERGRPNDDPAVLARMKNAHLNCTENFAVFAAIVVVAALLGKIAVVDALAGYVLFARVAQSVVHMIGTSLTLIALRGLFYVVQVVLMFWMIWKLLYG